MSQNKFFSIKNINEKEGEIKVYGEITKYPWKEYGETSALLFTEELNLLKDVKRINLRINSPGGSVFEAQTMYNSLKQFAKDRGIEIVTFIEGVAASAATFLALAADKVKIGEGCLFMIHNPSTYASGYSNELRKAADLLDKIKENILDIYEKKSSLSREDIAQKMDEETWFTAKEAVEAGFADEIETFEEVKNNITEIIDCNCLKTYKNIEKITNLASEVKNKEKGGKLMTLEELKNTHKEQLEEYKKEILNGAANSEYIKNIINEAVINERKRIENLLNIKTFNKKQEEEVKKAMFEEPKDSKDLIVEFYNSEAFKANEEIEKIKDEAEKSGLDKVQETPIPNPENKDEAILNAALESFND